MAAGCGGKPDTACAKPSGLYRTSWVRQGGNCHVLDDAIVSVDGSPAGGEIESGCTGTAMGDDTCAMDFDQTCDFSRLTGSTIITRGAIHWSANASSGTGTVSTVILSPTGLCSSDYTVTYTRP